MRKCTAKENKILRTHEADILSYDGLPTPSGNILPVLLFVILLFFGIGIGILTLFSIKNVLMIILFGILFPVIGTVIFMMWYIKGETTRLLKKRLKPFYHGDFTIGEATFLSYQKDYDGHFYETFSYYEDSLSNTVPESKVKYCHVDHNADLQEKEPILILYMENGNFIPMRMIDLCMEQA